MENSIIRSAIVYSLKCLAGVIIVYLLSYYFKYTDFIWCLISVILVTSPEGNDAIQLVVSRIKANLVGVGAGVLMLWIHLPLLMTLCGAVLITIAICYGLGLLNPMRTALAAAIIVTLHDGAVFWNTAVERIVSVLAGCLIALLITLFFHPKSILKQSKIKADNQEA